MKAFFIVVLKIASAILVVLIALAIVGWVHQAREAAKIAELSKLTRWPPVHLKGLGDVTFKLDTMWRDERFYYQLSVEGYSPSLKAAREEQLQLADQVDTDRVQATGHSGISDRYYESLRRRSGFGEIPFWETNPARPSLVMTFFDTEGFKVFQYSVPLREMDEVVDHAGQISGLKKNTNFVLPAKQYRQFAALEVAERTVRRGNLE